MLWTNAYVVLERERSQRQEKCIASKRLLTRAWAKSNKEEIQRIRKELKEHKKSLNATIYKSKKTKWKQLYEELENDMWGMHTRLLCKKKKE